MRGASWPTQDKAATPIRQARKFTARKKDAGTEGTKDQKLLRKELLDGAEAHKPAHVTIEKPKTLTRATPLHSVALRAAQR